MSGEEALEFRVEWESVPGVRAPELEATWARLELWVNGECASLLEEGATGAARRSVHGALYPLAEWIAFNWWSLCSHTRPAEEAGRLERARSPLGARHRASLPEWWTHHSLRAAGDGQAWPNLVILPFGGTTRVQWWPDRTWDPTLPVRFIGQGDAELSNEPTQAALAGLVESVLTRLAEQGVSDTPLHKEWAAVRSADGDEAAFCHAAARLGFDPYWVSDAEAESIVRVGRELENPLLHDFLDSVTPSLLLDGLRWIQRASQRVAAEAFPPGALAARLAGLSPEATGASRGREPPWTAGYRQARRVRSESEVSVAEPFPVEELIAIARRSSPDPRLVGLAGRTGDTSGALVVGRQLHQASQRFAQARAVWHLIHEPAAWRFLLSPSATDRHQTARAFAAELLAPAEGIRARLDASDSAVADEEIAAASRHFRTSELVIAHQIENQLGLPVGEL